MFKIGRGKRPAIEALKLVVRFTVGNGKRPDLGTVEFAVKFIVGKGRKPDRRTVGFAPEVEMMGYAVPLILGKMPAEIERLGIVEMFKVGKGRLEYV